MEIHPSQIPTSCTFDVKDYSDTFKVLNEILAMDFKKESGFKILMPKDKNLARRIGYTIVNELNKGLRMQRYTDNVKYFVYHHDTEHYAIILVSQERLAKLHA
jgi:hypothetical protein